MGRIYMLIGKSASGKDKIYRSLIDDRRLNLNPIILYTTRPMREGESEGTEYHFTDIPHMKLLRDKGLIIEERVYHTIFGDWYYFTADDGSIDIEKDKEYITIGTIDSFVKMKDYFGDENICPVYIEVDDEIRLLRAIEREKKQPKPAYKELCRRFISDCEDFSDERLKNAGINKSFSNNSTLEECISNIKSYINKK